MILSLFLSFLALAATPALKDWGANELRNPKMLKVAKVATTLKTFPKSITENKELKKIIEERLKIFPRKERRKISKKIVHVAQMDLNSNGKMDFIVGINKWVPAHKEFIAHRALEECLVDDAGKVRNCGTFPPQGEFGFTYRYFAQLDQDPMLEVFVFDGDEDYSHYNLWKLDPKTWAAKRVVNFFPSIFKPGSQMMEVSGAYPWWIDDLTLSPEKKIYARFNKCFDGPSIDERTHSTADIVFQGSLDKDKSNMPDFKKVAEYLGAQQAYSVQELQEESEKREKIFSCSTDQDCKFIPGPCDQIAVNKDFAGFECIQPNFICGGMPPEEILERKKEWKKQKAVCENKLCITRE